MTTFTPHMLANFDQLQTLFTGEKEIHEIEALPNPSPSKLYYSRWQVAWIVVSFPLKLITSLFLETISYLLCCFKGTSRKLHIYSAGFTSDFFHLFSQWSYGSRFLAPAWQKHRADTSDVYSASPVAKKDILSKELRESIFKKWSEIQFYNPRGNCRGGSYWFNFLFMKALFSKAAERATCIKDLAKAVAHQFKDGVPRQAALLQSLGGAERRLLNLQSECLLEFTQTELKQSEQRIKGYLDDLPDGAYLLALHDHGVSYLKFGDEQMIFDLNVGLYTIENTDQLLDEIKCYLKGKATPIHCSRHSLFIDEGEAISSA